MSVASITETGQYLTFILDEEVFALDISTVREVLDFTKITKVPQTPDFMMGVINLRGSVMPVVDMRLKFGLSKTEQNCIHSQNLLKNIYNRYRTAFSGIKRLFSETFLDSLSRRLHHWIISSYHTRVCAA